MKLIRVKEDETHYFNNGTVTIVPRNGLKKLVLNVTPEQFIKGEYKWS